MVCVGVTLSVTADGWLFGNGCAGANLGETVLGLKPLTGAEDLGTGGGAAGFGIRAPVVSGGVGVSCRSTLWPGGALSGEGAPSCP